MIIIEKNAKKASYMGQAAIEKTAKVAAEYQSFKSKLDKGVAEKKKEIQDVVDEIANASTKYAGRPARWIKDKINWLTAKLNKLKQRLIDWTKKQLDTLTAWMNKQKKAIEDEVEAQLKAKAEALA